MHTVLNLWCDAINSNEKERVTGLYAPDAALLPTLSPVLCNTPETIDEYFTALFEKPNVAVDLAAGTIKAEQITESAAFICGHYTFSYDSEDGRQTLPARFSFVVDESLDRPILHHHSSAVP